MAYCTLFDSNYLDKGSVMIDSLLRVQPDAEIYVLCMDDLCEHILSNEYNNLYILSLKHFIEEESIDIRNRSRAEFCWTCTSMLIRYVLRKTKDNIATYIDADLFFYKNPSTLYNEMALNRCTVQTLSHNFPLNIFKKYMEEESGKNCVEFVSFSKETKSLKLLDEWVEQCVAECSLDNGGDQKYTSNWNEKEFVNISKNLGAGVAPWNISRFKKKNNYIVDKYTKERIEIVFYHFQNVINYERNLVRIEPLYNYLFIDTKLVLDIYLPYLFEIEKKKRLFNAKYNFCPLIQRYVSADKNAKTNRVHNKSFLKSLIKYIHIFCRIIRGKRGYIDTSKYSFNKIGEEIT